MSQASSFSPDERCSEMQPAFDNCSREEHKEKWIEFLRYETRELAFCTYHELYLWRNPYTDALSISPEIQRQIKSARKKLPSSGCRLCEIFSSDSMYASVWSVMSFQFERNWWDRDPVKQAASVFPTAATYSMKRHEGWPGIPSHIFHLGFSGFPSHEGLIPRILSPTHIDYEVLLGWLNACKNDHKSSCGDIQIQKVPGLTVIDCHTRRVGPVPENGCDYVALSYAWGGVDSTGDILAPCPATIEDAIIVTVALGFRYLWVDQYCIDQHSQLEKASQILMMDRIYSQAQLCIIAAAGANANYGLPGVGNKARKPQRRISFGGLECIQRYHSGSTVKGSTWSSRAWTFQEGCLSRRRLVFTDREVVFLCSNMYCQESLYWNCQDAQKVDFNKNRLLEAIPNIVVKDISYGETDEQHHVKLLIGDYSKRELSFDADTINAFEGIFKSLHVRHCWGLPFERLPDKDEKTIALNWDGGYADKKNIGFPSWSWASRRGWTSFGRPSAGSLACAVELLLPDGTWLTADDYINSNTIDCDASLGKLIRVTGYISRPQLVDEKWYKKYLSGNFNPDNLYSDGAFAILKSTDHPGYMWCRIRWDYKYPDSFQTEANNILMLYVGIDNGQSENQYLLLLPSGSRFRRVGLATQSNRPFHLKHTFTKKDLRWKLGGHDFLKRTDDEFTARTVKRTIVLE